MGRDPLLALRLTSGGALRLTSEGILLAGGDTFILEKICELLASELYYSHSFQSSKTGTKVGSIYANITTSSRHS